MSKRPVWMSYAMLVAAMISIVFSGYFLYTLSYRDQGGDLLIFPMCFGLPSIMLVVSIVLYKKQKQPSKTFFELAYLVGGGFFVMGFCTWSIYTMFMTFLAWEFYLIWVLPLVLLWISRKNVVWQVEDGDESNSPEPEL